LELGAITPSLSAGNVHDGEGLRHAISGALAAVDGRSRDVIAVLPDAAIRVLLLDFENLPAKSEERDAVIRFRLKKSLPFDVERAALSYDVRPGTNPIQVVVAITPRVVLEEYESAFRDAGYSPGVVLPSSLAALGLVDDERPT